MGIDKYQAFLESIEQYNQEYCSIKIKSKFEPLSFCFWSFSEIGGSLTLKNEWGIEEHLIPFYGDWHDVICLDFKTGKVVYLNDQRELIDVWDTTNEFLQSLSKIEQVTYENKEVDENNTYFDF